MILYKPPKPHEKKVQVTKQVVAKSGTTQSIQTETVEQEVISGRCHVIDGDTIVIGKQHIRFAGVDAPDLNKPYGKQAKWALVELCKGQNVTANLTGETSYDRVVAKCFLDNGRDIPHFPNADYKHLETPNARRKLRWRPKKKD